MCLFFFFIFRCFPPLLLNHVDVRHEVGNKLVFSIACNQTGFFASSSPAITSLLLSCQWTDLTGCDQNLIYWTRLHAKSCVQILFVSEFDVYWHWFLRFEHAWLVCWTTTACRYRTALGLYDSCMSSWALTLIYFFHKKHPCHYISEIYNGWLR